MGSYCIHELIYQFLALDIRTFKQRMFYALYLRPLHVYVIFIPGSGTCQLIGFLYTTVLTVAYRAAVSLRVSGNNEL